MQASPRNIGPGTACVTESALIMDGGPNAPSPLPLYPSHLLSPRPHELALSLPLSLCQSLSLCLSQAFAGQARA
eukprot:2094937-Pleurochrysis_carterae.AAC.1